jgi:hypothetical protein
VSAEAASRGEIRLAGMVSAVRPLLTKDGRAFCAVTIEDLTGQVEVTVWPDVYETSRELWVDGKILRLTARVRQRDERLNVTVINVAEYEPNAEDGVPEALREVVQDVETFAAPKRPEPPAPYANGGPRNGNGRNGNGHKNGNGAAAATPAPPSRLLVRIEVHERPDAEADDRLRLRRLVETLGAAPGQDSVRLTIVAPGGQRHELELPSVTMSPRLQAMIEPIVKAEDWGDLYAESVGVASVAYE